MNTDLLLLHGTIYGHLPVDGGWYVFLGRTSSLVNSEATPWRDDIPYAHPPDQPLCGPMTDNAPIDVIHWNTGPGVPAPSGLEIWNQCLTLFMRHI